MQKKIVNRPLAGSAPRGRTLEEDEVQEVNLLKDGKQCAEHIMLVDLGRNDVGKVTSFVSLVYCFLTLFWLFEWNAGTS